MHSTVAHDRAQQYRTTLIVALALLVVAPALYLVILATVAGPTEGGREAQPTLLYVLLAMSVLQLIFASVIARAITAPPRQPGDRGRAVLSVWIVRMAMVESIFIYGLVYYFISRNFGPVFWFYAVGLAGIVLHWPTRERFTEVADRLEQA